MRISDWSSDVCSSDLGRAGIAEMDVAELDAPLSRGEHERLALRAFRRRVHQAVELAIGGARGRHPRQKGGDLSKRRDGAAGEDRAGDKRAHRHHALGAEADADRSEEHTPELQSPMRLSY